MRSVSELTTLHGFPTTPKSMDSSIPTSSCGSFCHEGHTLHTELCGYKTSSSAPLDIPGLEAGIGGRGDQHENEVFSDMDTRFTSEASSDCSSEEFPLANIDSLPSSPGSCHVIPQWMPSPRPGMVFQAIRKEGRIVLEEMRAARIITLQPVRKNGRLVLRELKQRTSQLPHWQAYSTYASCRVRSRGEGDHSLRRWSMDETHFYSPDKLSVLPHSSKPPLPEKRTGTLFVTERSPWTADEGTCAELERAKPCNRPASTHGEAGRELKNGGNLEKFSESKGLCRSRSLPAQCGTDCHTATLYRGREADKPALAEDMARLLECASRTQQKAKKKLQISRRAAEEQMEVEGRRVQQDVQF